MKYIKFEIENYKGIKNLTLDLGQAPKINIFTFVGLNESGKTTILDALNFFFEDVPQDKRHTLIPKNRKTNFNGNVSICATLSLTHEDESAIQSFAKKRGFTITENIKEIILSKKYIFQNSNFTSENNPSDIKLIGKKGKSPVVKELKETDQLYTDIVGYIQENLLPPIIYYQNFLFNFPSRIYLERTDDETQEQEFYRNVLQDVLDALGEDLNLKKHVLERLKSDEDEKKEALASTIHRMSSKISQTVFKNWDNLFQSKDKEIVIKHGETDGRYYLEIKLKEGAEEYHISERSLGFRWFFAFLLFTEFRKNRASDAGEILFLLDEPASNLHSAAQMKLIETLHGLADRSRLIYTTHSHHLINPDWLEGAFIIRNKAIDYDNGLNYDASKTDIDATPYRQFVSTYPNQQTYFQPILDSLDYQPSKLEMVPDIIIVEGKNDFYTLRYINDVILGGKYNLNFYPGGGAGKNSQVIRLYLSWGKDFIVLMDGDQAGQSAKNSYINDIGMVVEDKIFHLADVNAKWAGMSTEDLFSSDKERMKIINAFDQNIQQYTKKKFNEAIQNLLFFRTKLDLNKTTIDRFEKILNFCVRKFE